MTTQRADSVSEQTFIFCIGATKAGTSWLYDYLNQRKDCRLSALKELHYFDSLEQGTGGWYRKSVHARCKHVRRALDTTTDLKRRAWQKRLADDAQAWLDAFDGETRDDDAYLRYVKRDSENARLIGDFTPAYGLLKETTLKAMSQITKCVRFVYLLRDPVDRIWSHIRMVAGRDDQGGLRETFDAVMDGSERDILDRSNYRRTLKRLSAAVPRAAFHIEYYERLFTPEAIERLCAFLGLPMMPAQFERVVHEGAKAKLSTGQRVQLQTLLKPQYNFVEKFMGELPAEWSNKMVSA